MHLMAEERRRAEEAYSLCARFRHPGTKSLPHLLDQALAPGRDLTGQDLRNARNHIRSCPARVEGKMRASTDRMSTAEPADKIGGRVYINLVSLSTKSIGGNTLLCIAIDEKSSYGICIPMKSKNDTDIRNLGIQLLAEFKTHKHRVDNICTDDETCLRAWRTQLGAMGVSVSSTPAGSHCKRVERYIQKIKARRQAMLAGLPYELPAELEAESFVDAIYWSNAVLNTSTGAQMSPARLFTGATPFMPDIPFGSHGVFFCGRNDQKTKAMWGVFLGYGSEMKYMRVYDPTTKWVQAHYKFEHLGTETPSAWGFKPHIRPPDREKQANSASRLPHIQSDNVLIQRDERNNDAERKTPEGVASRASEGDLAMGTDTPTDLGASEARDVHTDNADAIEYIYSSSTLKNSDNSPVYIDAVKPSVIVNKGDAGLGPRFKRSVSIAAVATSVVREFARRQQRKVTKSWRDGEKLVTERLQEENKTEIGALNDMGLIWNVKAQCASSKQAMKDQTRRGAILASIYTEIDNREQPGVLTPIRYYDIPRDMRAHVVGVHTLHKEKFKFKAYGTSDEDKTRPASLSNLRQEETVGETHCHTLNPIDAMTRHNLAAVREEMVISAHDIKGAFFLKRMDDRRVFIRVAPDIVRYWVEKRPVRKQMIHNDGCLYFEFNRWVYGHEAPRKSKGWQGTEYFIDSRADESKSCKHRREQDGTLIVGHAIDAPGKVHETRRTVQRAKSGLRPA